MNLIYYLCLFITIIFLLLCKYIYTQRNQNLPPSPFALPILGHLHLLKKPLHRTLQSLSLKFGPIFFLKLGFRNVLIVSSPSFVEEIFTKNDIVFANRPNFLAGKYLGQNYTHLGWAPYGDHWRNLRRITSLEIFSSNRIIMSASLRREEIHRFIKQMDAETEDWKLIEMKSALFDLTVNIMMKILTGKPCYEDEMKSDEKRLRREFLKDTFVPNMAMNLGDSYQVLRKFGFLGLEKKLVKLQKTRDVFLKELIEEGRSRESDLIEGEEKARYIDGLLALQKMDPNYYTDDMLQGLIAVSISHSI
ncbi:hypothetical protein ACHQM5_025242 [Ranunculus cassubicifolius]